jgi:hypothetical protein
MLRHQRPGEVELSLHDGKPVLFEHERGDLPLTKRLTLADKVSDSFAHGVAREAGDGAQVHMPQSVQTILQRPLPERTDLRGDTAG